MNMTKLTVGQQYQKSMAKTFKYNRKLFCIMCNKSTDFKYNGRLKHSQCVICNNSFKKIPSFLNEGE